MKRKKTQQQLAALLATSIFALAWLAGCGGNKTEPESGQAAGSKGPVKISTLQPYWGGFPKKDEALFKKYEEVMNAEITPTFAQGPTMMDKVNVALASGNLPDILVVFQGNQPSIVSAVRAGAFWEVGKYIDKYPNIKASREKNRDQNIMIDGKIWALYDSTAISKLGINIRKDWLDALGLKEPKSMNDMYNVLKAFTLNDPDKNGKNDTLGTAMYISNGKIEGFSFIASKFGAPNGYKVENGKFIPDFETNEYRDAVKFLRKLYAEGLMNKDFAYAKRPQVEETVQKGSVGAAFGNLDLTYFEKLFQLVPTAKLASYSDMEGPNLQYANLGYWSTLMFPKSSIKTEERLHEILGALDKLAAPQHKDLRLYGVEGENYKIENGNKVLNADTEAKLITMNVLSLTEEESDLTSLPPYLAEQKKVVKSNEKVKNLVRNPATGLISQTWIQLGNELDRQVNEAVVKYTIGELDDKGYEQMIEKWKSSGGSKVLAEYEEEAKKLK